MKLNITSGPWIYESGKFNTNDRQYLEGDAESEANATAIVTAVNNTYHKGINPEAVPELLQLVEEIYKSELLNQGVQNRLKLIIKKAKL